MIATITLLAGPLWPALAVALALGGGFGFGGRRREGTRTVSRAVVAVCLVLAATALAAIVLGVLPGRAGLALEIALAVLAAYGLGFAAGRILGSSRASFAWSRKT